MLSPNVGAGKAVFAGQRSARHALSRALLMGLQALLDRVVDGNHDARYQLATMAADLRPIRP
jgi:hypothetical protein